jgi:starvation-inducible outer membrane lipoprotein
MRKSLFLVLMLSGCATVPTGVEAASYKRCPDGSQVRKNVACQTIPSFSAQSATFNEGDGIVTITISKTGSNGKSSSINYSTQQHHSDRR